MAYSGILRITRDEALALYEKGEDVYLYPSIEMANNILTEPTVINKNTHNSFFLAVDTYRFYNCTLGERVLFYIKKEEED